MSDIAIIETGGKQYLVKAGAVVKVGKLDLDPQKNFELKDLLQNKKVSASVVEHGKHKKVTGRIFKNKTRDVRFPHGHRQDFTAIKIDSIS